MKVFVALAVLAIVGTVSALQCFNCNSALDSACADDFHQDSPALKEAFMTECDETKGTPFCRKIKTYIERVRNTTLARIQRDCGFKKREGYECYQKRAEDYIMNTCQCDEELCNGAPAITTSVASVFAVTLPFFIRFL